MPSRSRRSRTRSFTPLAFGFALLLLGGCRRNRDWCDRDGVCDCSGEDECIIACGAASCDVQCNQTSESCGVVCDDDCTFECNDTNHCSSYSGDRSDIRCHNLPSCASECGADCTYDCFSVDECSVQVGPNSQVSCRNTAECETTCTGDCAVECASVSRCEVSCTGECEVELSCESVADCRVECADGFVHAGEGPGRHTCTRSGS